ncbi:acetyl-CoA C-acetyltransferase [Seinonella peptonophila]|uniref:acetyl-CoA C-acetyltransferase n=1 Tax=Seinonella peptonophila TaxID=112248 RepID=A0A1M4XXC6_9BACL|nr:acetyl-CoA C-acetyltransferase [Seinonella peptonophila]SHE97953.1 acetyl-CoA C-acetyltransferase [Seinonella peptonophila]
MKSTWIITGKRTPFAKYGGALQKQQAVQLGARAIRATVQQYQTKQPIDAVIMGMVLQAGAGQLASRQAAHGAGLPWEVQSETINKVCASGMRSITLADQMIRAGDAELIIAGGMESMTHAPYLLPHVRWGQRLGHGKLMDSMLVDGLWCAYENVHMIQHAAYVAREYQISREAQDDWALRSHQRAWKATQKGYFAAEMISGCEQEKDETIRPDTSREKLAQLRPVFDPQDTITPGNAPSLNDGAVALLLASETVAPHFPKRMAQIVAHVSIACEPRLFPISPIFAVQKLLQKTGYRLDEIDCFEMNEAFALVPLLALKELAIDATKVNINGGAVAIGHPIGASGSRIVLTLIHALRRRGGGLGIAAICSGGGQGDAILIRVE